MSRNISKEPEKDDEKYDEKDLEKDDELEYIETRPRVYCAEVSLPDDNGSVIWWYWVSKRRYWLIPNGKGKYGAILVGAWWYWISRGQ